MVGSDAAGFIEDAMSNAANRLILQRLPALALPDAWLVAGCLFQAVWNRQAGRTASAGIKDYDLFYFDPTDLSERGEQMVDARVQAVLGDLGVTVEAKNQARVHVWYPEWFGFPYPALTSARDGIDRFLVSGTCVGMQPGAGDSPTLYAPYGLADLYRGILRPNPLCDHRSLFLKKADSYRQRWYWLQIDLQPMPLADGRRPGESASDVG